MSYKRRNFFINPRFQLQFIFSSLTPFLLCTLSFWLSIEYFFNKMIKFGQKGNLPPGHPFFTFINTQRIELLTVMFYVTIITAILVIIWSILFSHRIAGPLYKVRKYFTEQKTFEDLLRTPLRFRKNDFFPEIAESFNQLVKTLTRPDLSQTKSEDKNKDSA